MYVIAKPCAPPKLPRVLMLLSLTLFLPLSFRFFFSLSPHSIDLPLLDRNPLLFVPLGALVSACDCYFGAPGTFRGFPAIPTSCPSRWLCWALEVPSVQLRTALNMSLRSRTPGPEKNTFGKQQKRRPRRQLGNSKRIFIVILCVCLCLSVGGGSLGWKKDLETRSLSFTKVSLAALS